MAERERWRKVRRADGYKVSSLGRVRSVDRTLSDGRAAGGVMLETRLDDDGYRRVTISGESVLVHQLVLEAFAGPRPYGLEALHDPDLSAGREDCRLSVLRWGTDRENGRDKRKAKSKSEVETSPSVVRTVSQGDVQ